MFKLLNIFYPFSRQASPTSYAPTPIYERGEERDAAVQRVILSHTAWAASTGLIPFVQLDMFAVSALQLDMVRRLAAIYGIDFEINRGKATILSLVGSGIAGASTRLVRWIPVVGLPLGSLTMTVLAGASTYALGDAFRRHFESGGTFLDLDMRRIQTFFKESHARGRNIVTDMQRAPAAATETVEYTTIDTSAGLLEQLRDLKQQHDTGTISNALFEQRKMALIANF